MYDIIFPFTAADKQLRRESDSVSANAVFALYEPAEL
jgi:hypothetical protein